MTQDRDFQGSLSLLKVPWGHFFFWVGRVARERVMRPVWTPRPLRLKPSPLKGQRSILLEAEQSDPALLATPWTTNSRGRLMAKLLLWSFRVVPPPPPAVAAADWSDKCTGWVTLRDPFFSFEESFQARGGGGGSTDSQRSATPALTTSLPLTPLPPLIHWTGTLVDVRSFALGRVVEREKENPWLLIRSPWFRSVINGCPWTHSARELADSTYFNTDANEITQYRRVYTQLSGPRVDPAFRSAPLASAPGSVPALPSAVQPARRRRATTKGPRRRSRTPPTGRRPHGPTRAALGPDPTAWSLPREGPSGRQSRARRGGHRRVRPFASPVHNRLSLNLRFPTWNSSPFFRVTLFDGGTSQIISPSALPPASPRREAPSTPLLRPLEPFIRYWARNRCRGSDPSAIAFHRKVTSTGNGWESVAIVSSRLLGPYLHLVNNTSTGSETPRDHGTLQGSA